MGSCWCDSVCVKWGDCCHDAEDLCKGTLIDYFKKCCKHLHICCSTIFTARIRRKGNVFTGVCSFTPGVPQSQVLSQVSGPRSFLEGTPVLAGGVIKQCLVGWGGGTPVSGYPRTGQDWDTPGQERTGILS